jgi:hypothetical protein
VASYRLALGHVVDRAVHEIQRGLPQRLLCVSAAVGHHRLHARAAEQHAAQPVRRVQVLLQLGHLPRSDRRVVGRGDRHAALRQHGGEVFGRSGHALAQQTHRLGGAVLAVGHAREAEDARRVRRGGVVDQQLVLERGGLELLGQGQPFDQADVALERPVHVNAIAAVDQPRLGQVEGLHEAVDGNDRVAL